VPVVSMSKQEFDRLEVLLGVQLGRLRLADACELIGLQRRQVFRLLRGLQENGAASVVSKRRGKPSNNRLPAEIRDLAVSLVRERYRDFGPTLAAEKLAEHHGCTVSRETLRQWMMADGLWVDRRHKLPSPHQPRRRRDCLGELVQIDGSEHAWFEDRGETCTLLAFVDDATSRLMQLRFVASESAFDYFRATKDYLETHGKPVAFYSDKHGIFRVNAKDAIGGDRVTQFGRALAALNIDIICANSPQAKGRVERAFGTLQDRLVKELRLAGIASIEAANGWVAGFVDGYNKRFGRVPANAKNLHRPLTASDDLHEILAWREARTVTKNLTLHYDRMMLLLEPTPFVRGLVRKRVDVVNYPDGRFAVQFEGVSLPFRVFDKIQTVQPGAIVENKRLGAALALVKQMQDAYPHERRRYHPARQRPPNNLEAPGMPSKSRPSRAVIAAMADEAKADEAKNVRTTPPAPS
jgi:Winged helix-turn helix